MNLDQGSPIEDFCRILPLHFVSKTVQWTLGVKRVKKKRFFRLEFSPIRTEAFCEHILLHFLISESETRSVVARRWLNVRSNVLILAPSIIGETSNFDHLELIVSALKFSDAPGWELLSARWIRVLRRVWGGWSNLFLKADNFGSITNKCCFQATKSPKSLRLKFCCWESFYPFSPRFFLVLDSGGLKLKFWGKPQIWG